MSAWTKNTLTYRYINSASIFCLSVVALATLSSCKGQLDVKSVGGTKKSALGASTYEAIRGRVAISRPSLLEQAQIQLGLKNACKGVVYLSRVPTNNSNAVVDRNSQLKSEIADDGFFEISGLVTHGISIAEDGDPWRLEYIGCQGDYESRILIGDHEQDISRATTVVDYGLDLSKKNVTGLVKNHKDDIQYLHNEIASYLGKEATPDELLRNDKSGKLFEEIFEVKLSNLLDAPGRIVSASIPAKIPELVSTTFEVRAAHWDINYKTAYLWKLNDKVVSMQSSTSWSPSANEQGTHVLALFVGRDDGSGAVDQSKPYKSYAFPIEVEDTVKMEAVPFSVFNAVDVSGVKKVFARNIQLALNTGSAKINCATFHSMVLTENTTLPPSNIAGLKKITCTEEPSQLIPYTIISAGDGPKTIRLWAYDDGGKFSATAQSETVVLDTRPLELSLGLSSNLAQPSSSVSVLLSATSGNPNATVKLYYKAGVAPIGTCSESGIASWTLLSNGLRASHVTYSWALGGLSSGTYSLCGVIENVPQTTVYTEISSSLIVNAAPTFSFVHPVASDAAFQVGAAFSISWSANDLDDTAHIALYTNTSPTNCSDGSIAGWSLLSSSLVEGVDSSFSFTPTGPGAYYICAKIDDGVNLPVYTMSSAPALAIQGAAPILSISEPNGVNDIVAPNATYTINFAAADADSVDPISLYYRQGSSTGCVTGNLSGWTLLTSALLSGTDTSFAWNTTGVSSGSYFICGKITDGVNPAVYALSSAPLIINAAPTFSFVSPTGSSNFVTPNSSFTVNYTANDPDNAADISLYYRTSNSNCTDGSLSSWTLITNSLVTGSGSSYAWNVGSLASGSYYLCAKVNDGVNTPIYAVSSGTVTVNRAPTIAVTMPGMTPTVVVKGNPFLAGFTAADSDDDAAVALYLKSASSNCTDGSLTGWTLLTSGLHENSDTNYSWDTTGVTSGNYYVCAKIDDGKAQPVFAVSTSYVTVNSQPTVSITNPSGSGTSIAQSGTYNISFNATDSDDAASLSLYYKTSQTNCTDGSLTGWSLLTNSLVEGTDSSYSWDTTGRNPGSYFICAKISDSVTPATFAVSSGSIDINAQPSLSITTPSSGAVIALNGTYTISFSAADADSPGAGISLYYKSGSATNCTNGSLTGWTPITTSLVLGTDTSHAWNTSGIAAGHYFICGKINDTVNPSTFAVSANSLKISSPPTISITDPIGPTPPSIPVGVASYTLAFSAADADDAASISLYYKSGSATNCTNGSLTGWTTLTTALVSGTDSSFSWNTSALAAGNYYICAKISDGVNSNVFAVSSVGLNLNAAPLLSIDEPNGTLDTVAPGASYVISFTASDADSTGSGLALYYKTSSAANCLNGSLTGWTLLTNSLVIGTDTSYSWSTGGLSSGMTYYVCGKANDNLGNVTYAVSSGAMTINEPPTITFNNPLTTTYLALGNASSLSINANDADDPGATFSFYYKTSNSSCSSALTGWTAIATGLSGATPLVRSWTPGSAGTYYICAKGADAYSSVFALSSGTVTVDATSPSTPANPRFTQSAPGGSTITASNGASFYLVWDASSDAESGVASYSVNYYVQASCGGTATTVSAGTNTNYLMSGATDRGTYSFKVTATNGAGQTAQSACSSSIISYSSNPDSFSFLGPNYRTSSTSPTLTWNASGGSVSYAVTLNSGNNCSSVTNTYNPTSASQALSGLSNGTTYYVCITASNPYGSRTMDVQPIPITVDTGAPSAGSGPSIGTVTTDSVALTWTQASDGVSSSSNIYYRVYYSTSSMGATPSASGILFDKGLYNSTSVVVSGLLANTTYYFNVVALDEAGNAVNYSQASATTAEFCGGSGTSGDPWQVCTLSALQRVGNHLGEYFIQTSDIDAEGSALLNAGTLGKYSGFLPIGAQGTPFTGSYDGQNRRISKLVIYRTTTDYVGLFGYIGSSGTVSNVNVESAFIKGQNYVGLVAGRVDGTLTSSYGHGRSGGTQYVGCLAGYVGATVITKTRGRCLAIGTSDVGGLVGYVQSTGGVDKSFAESSVSATSNVGGLVGTLVSGTVSNSYSISAIQHTGNYGGGLVGSASTSTISKSYFAGSINVNGGNYSGGLVGQFSDSSLQNSWANANFRTSGTWGGNAGQVTGISSGTNSVSNVFGVNWGATISGCSGSGTLSCSLLNSGYQFWKTDSEPYITGGWFSGSAVWMIPEAGGGHYPRLAWENYNSGIKFAVNYRNGRKVGSSDKASYTLHGSCATHGASISVNATDGNANSFSTSTTCNYGFWRVTNLNLSSAVQGNITVTATMNASVTPSLRLELDSTYCDANPAATVPAGTPYFPSGAGSSVNPYLICTPGQFDKIRNYAGSSFKLMNNIDLSDVSFTGKIAQATNGFSLEGSSFVLKNLSVSASSGSVALFTQVSGTVSFKNLFLENFDVISGTAASPTAGAALVGRVNSTPSVTMQNLVVTGDVKGGSTSGALLGIGHPMANFGLNNVIVDTMITAAGGSGIFGTVGTAVNSQSIARMSFYGEVVGSSAYAISNFSQSTVNIDASDLAVFGRVRGGIQSSATIWGPYIGTLSNTYFSGEIIGGALSFVSGTGVVNNVRNNGLMIANYGATRGITSVTASLSPSVTPMIKNAVVSGDIIGGDGFWGLVETGRKNYGTCWSSMGSVESSEIRSRILQANSNNNAGLIMDDLCGFSVTGNRIGGTVLAMAQGVAPRADTLNLGSVSDLYEDYVALVDGYSYGIAGYSGATGTIPSLQRLRFKSRLYSFSGSSPAPLCGNPGACSNVQNSMISGLVAGGNLNINGDASYGGSTTMRNLLIDTKFYNGTSVTSRIGFSAAAASTMSSLVVRNLVSLVEGYNFVTSSFFISSLSSPTQLIDNLSWLASPSLPASSSCVGTNTGATQVDCTSAAHPWVYRQNTLGPLAKWDFTNIWSFATSTGYPSLADWGEVRITSPTTWSITASNQSSFSISGTCSVNGSGVLNLIGAVSGTIDCVGNTFSTNLDFSSTPTGPVVLGIAYTSRPPDIVYLDKPSQ